MIGCVAPGKAAARTRTTPTALLSWTTVATTALPVCSGDQADLITTGGTPIDGSSVDEEEVDRARYVKDLLHEFRWISHLDVSRGFAAREMLVE